MFEVALGRRPAGADEPAVELDGDAVAFDAAGADQVVYRLAPNPGEPARPLAKIASGGELSRVALAVKQVLAEADATPTLVFDEVDTGIGGRSADPVGRSLWALARRHQVLCVTHLPQIAAHADVQFRIAKRERDGRTITEVERLDREGRIVELAQMLGGQAGGATTLASARELLDRAGAGANASARPAEAATSTRWSRSRTPSTTTWRTCGSNAGLPRARSAPTGGPADFAASRGAARGWDRSPDVALDYLAARTRRGRPHDPGLAPTSLRRRAAALKGFYRFCFGRGLIGTDVAAHLDLPRQPRLLPRR